MLAHTVVRLTGLARRGSRTFSNPIYLAALLTLSAAVLGACSVASSENARPHPADPKARVPAAAYRSVTGGYEAQRPADPQSWRERNQRVVPQEKE